jgi:hypothetical protein
LAGGHFAKSCGDQRDRHGREACRLGDIPEFTPPKDGLID